MQNVSPLLSFIVFKLGDEIEKICYCVIGNSIKLSNTDKTLRPGTILNSDLIAICEYSFFTTD